MVVPQSTLAPHFRGRSTPLGTAPEERSRSSDQMVVVLVWWPEEGKNLFVKRLETEDQGLPGSGWSSNMQHLDALKALKHPARGGAVGRLAQVVRNRLAHLNQAQTEPMLGQAIDEQA